MISFKIPFCNTKIHTMMPLLLTLCAAIFWGANFNAGKLLVGYFEPLHLVAIRFLCSFLCILPIILFTKARTSVISTFKQNFWVYGLLSLIGIIGYNGFVFEGVKYTSPVNAALIMATNPPLTMFFAAFALQEKMNNSQKLGAMISLLSVVIIITQGSLQALLQLQFSFGDLVVMLANVCWALYNVLSKRYLKNSLPLITTASTMLLSTIFLWIIGGSSQVEALHRLFEQPSSVYYALVYMVILGTVTAYLFWNYGISQLGAGKAAVFFNLIPVVTTIISFVHGETISMIQIVGGLSVIFGVLLSTKMISFRQKQTSMISTT
jgi:drug/metabolite transporter (DMT)-like permease